MITSYDVLKFIIRNRSRYPGPCLADWSYRQILCQINQSVKGGTILVVLNSERKLRGVVLGEWVNWISKNHIHIVTLVTDGIATTSELAIGAQRLFHPLITYSALRKGKYRQWSSAKLFRHLTKSS